MGNWEGWAGRRGGADESHWPIESGRARDVGLREVVALEQQRLGGDLGEPVADIEAGGVAARP
jgi:hypothetical protein